MKTFDQQAFDRQDNYIRWLFMTMAGLALSIIVACASLGLPEANTFNEKTAAALLTVTEIRTQAAAAVTSGKLKPDDALNIQEQANNARQGIDIARQVHAVDPAAADAKLTAVRTVLLAIQSYLATKGVSK